MGGGGGVCGPETDGFFLSRVETLTQLRLAMFAPLAAVNPEKLGTVSKLQSKGHSITSPEPMRFLYLRFPPDLRTYILPWERFPLEFRSMAVGSRSFSYEWSCPLECHVIRRDFGVHFSVMRCREFQEVRS